MPHERKIPRPSAEILAFARGLRCGSVPPELFLWQLLRARRLGGFKFRRQHPMEPYVLDFYCASARLAVELDGGQHAEQVARDARRDAAIRQRGIEILRFWNNDVLEQTEDVLSAILQAAQERATPSPLAPLPEGRGE